MSSVSSQGASFGYGSGRREPDGIYHLCGVGTTFTAAKVIIDQLVEAIIENTKTSMC